MFKIVVKMVAVVNVKLLLEVGSSILARKAMDLNEFLPI